jgi:hypothetical protein
MTPSGPAAQGSKSRAGRVFGPYWCRLLAIPHYLIVGVFLGGVHIGWAWPDLGLVGVLLLVAGFSLLFTERYPRGVFDLVMGLQRWALRVGVYASLMTDEYPPFRLDMGGREP